MPSKGMALTGIAIDYRLGFLGECRLDLGLRRPGNEFVLLTQVHEQRPMKAVNLAQILLSVTTVIDDRSVDSVAHSRQEGHQSPETVTKNGDVAGARGKFSHRVGGILNVLRAGVSVIC